MPSKDVINIFVPEQGVRQSIKRADIPHFLEVEINWLKNFRSRAINYLVWQGAQHDISCCYNAMMQYLNDLLREARKDKLEDLNAYVASARSLNLIVGQGVIGKSIDLLLDRNENEAAWGFLLYSGNFSHEVNFNNYLAPFRGAMFSSPSVKVGGLVDSLYASEERIASLDADMQQKLAAYEEQIKRQSATIEELEVLFRKKLPMEEPASFWQRVAESKERRWKVWLGLFSLLTIAPIALIICSWSLVSPELAKLVSTGNSFSLTGLAAIGVPALLYGWLLKNVSRVFIQQMNLADDAAHRRALTITWLGMVAEKRFEMSEQERALALNAMFRAAPSYMLDDGPPAGLMELLGKK